MIDTVSIIGNYSNCRDKVIVDDEGYPSWDWNDMSTSLDDYNSLLLRYFQQIDSVFYDVDEIVSESF